MALDTPSGSFTAELGLVVHGGQRSRDRSPGTVRMQVGRRRRAPATWGNSMNNGRKWAGWSIMGDREEEITPPPPPASESQEGVLETAQGRQHLRSLMQQRNQTNALT